MTPRERYLEFAKRNEIPMDLIYEYYNKFNRRPEINLSLETFSELFVNFINSNKVTLQSVRDYFDAQFEVVKVFDKVGNFLTIY